VVIRRLSSPPAGIRGLAEKAHKPEPDESGFGRFRQAPAELTTHPLAELAAGQPDKTAAPSPVLRAGHLLAALCFALPGLRPVAAAATKAQDAAGTTESQTPDKSRYTLFNPTPTEYMRELSADRPDKTDCPFTVDAGHFQIEMDFANMTYNRPNSERSNVRFTAFEVAPMNLKVGLLNNLDLQLVYASYQWEKTDSRDTGLIERQAGFDGITPRLKLNLAGNDGGFFALALIPFVKLPLSSGHLRNGSPEGGLGIPYAFDIPGCDVGFQTTFHCNPSGAGSGYHYEFDNSVSIGHRVIGKLSLSAEFFSSVTTELNSDWVGTVDTWLTYQLNKNLRLDAGVYIGVTPAADDWHPWVGMTWRF
jgi:hypothetical protein